MRLQHPDRPDQSLRLGYCLNVHPAEDLEGVCQGLRRTAAPVARAIAGEQSFGVGPWFAGRLAAQLAQDEAALVQLTDVLVQERLVPFTFNAFPFGGFHTPGLKSGVFRPTWLEPERSVFTTNVAQVALALTRVARALGEEPPAHVSISTHCGGFGEDFSTEAAQEGVASALAAMAEALAAVEEVSGLRIVLSLEPEPRSSVNDTAALPALFGRTQRYAPAAILRRHLGTCLDSCHAAVEFEQPEAAFGAATSNGQPLGKLQFSSALRLSNPSVGEGRRLLFGLAEETFLHQVTGRHPEGLVRATDLPEVQSAWDSQDAHWLACDELRCHFHVPVDLDQLESGLATTRAFADQLLDVALEHPERWGSPELHIEVETYTWDILPAQARGKGSLVAGLTRELTHVLDHLTQKGWQRSQNF